LWQKALAGFLYCHVIVMNGLGEMFGGGQARSCNGSAAMKAIDSVSASTALRDKLEQHTLRFRRGMAEADFDISSGIHPIVPIMLDNARLVQDLARDLFDEVIYLIGFSFPVVPKGEAHTRVQLSAAHKPVHIDQAIAALTKVGQGYDVLSKRREQIIEHYGL
jgi:glycine C-acetyltransferase